MPDDGLRGVVVGTAGLNPQTLFERTRATFQGTAAAHKKPVNTGVACWKCKEESGVIGNPVISDDSGLHCNSGHKYIDQDELLGHPHETVPTTPHVTQQENWVTVQFQMPAATLQALQQKYNQDQSKLKATFAAIAGQMAEPGTIVIGSADMKRLSDACGIPIRGSAELFGVIKGQQQQIEALEGEVKAKGPTQMASAGGVALRRGELILWFDPPTTAAMVEKAKAAGVSLEVFLEQYIGTANENNWF